jgi:RNA polymerase sigma factor (sigma-70 family)
MGQHGTRASARAGTSARVGVSHDARRHNERRLRDAAALMNTAVNSAAGTGRSRLPQRRDGRSGRRRHRREACSRGLPQAARVVDDRAIESMIPLVWHIIHTRFCRLPQCVSRDDMFQVAMEAVCRAAPRHDPGKGAFSTFVSPRAYGAILDHLRTEGPGSQNKPQPYPRSLDEVFTGRDGSPMTILDRFPVNDPEPPDDVLTRELYAAVDHLPDACGRIFRLYAEGELTPAEVAGLEGLSESRIYQQIEAARRELRPIVEFIDT